MSVLYSIINEILNSRIFIFDILSYVINMWFVIVTTLDCISQTLKKYTCKNNAEYTIQSAHINASIHM